MITGQLLLPVVSIYVQQDLLAKHIEAMANKLLLLKKAGMQRAC